ncbi:RNA polymerase I-specific transcription initiation factor RRN3 [Cimex lectularius]|uniref:RNA polymerase I-specific transcription initiation factor RRN3 n=1 Tax=Cimex lectularius TaxID=79782 RepID=A0A8I6TJF4_CIMLE|nr:RNA polymerase I-specific transcription initiation factor RRN3 [Cimex lectularius]
MSILNSAPSRASLGAQPGAKVVRFQLDFNLKSLLLDCLNEKDNKLYEELVCKIRDVGQEIRDDDLLQLLKEARGCISIIDRNFRLFVQVVLILQWTHRCEEVVNEYKGFLQDLCAAHNYYTKLVTDHLISSFKTDTEVWKDGVPSEKSRQCFEHIHQVILSILTVIPMSRDILLSSIQSCSPYIKKPAHEHEAYMYNILLISIKIPQLRYELLNFVITKIIALDVNSPKSEIERALETEEHGGVFHLEENTSHQISQTLDVCMLMMFKYIHSFCHENDNLVIEKLKTLYLDLVKIFDNMILPTHSTHYVQYLLFYLLGLKPALSVSFLKTLWSKLNNPSVPSVLRQAAVYYIASLLARASYVSIISVQEMLLDMAVWIHSYIVNQDESSNISSQDMRVHTVFYSICQSLFYVIAFRYKEFIQTKGGLAFLQGLNLSKIVTSRLNPLKVCMPVIVSHFASVARAYQLAYCYTVIERNSRSTLPQVYMDSTGATTLVASAHIDTYFPFDPYLLPSSKPYITPFYREYIGPQDNDVTETNQQNKTENDDDDDFLVSSTPTESPALETFSYSTSPGFLQ